MARKNQWRDDMHDPEALETTSYDALPLRITQYTLPVYGYDNYFLGSDNFEIVIIRRWPMMRLICPIRLLPSHHLARRSCVAGFAIIDEEKTRDLEALEALPHKAIINVTARYLAIEMKDMANQDQDLGSNVGSKADFGSKADGLAEQDLPNIPQLSPSVANEIVAMFDRPFTVSNGEKNQRGNP
ncbi:Uu.00g143030.m01.CDS01 [Anthostomella pinea]|uniref:Uu.00g143030.m01.CDS01 n=1 Tax=Anthostomella pinea TaxID=933095 RepID=A0AAI8VQL5_9PEZI|nr:Uu.00g143030.m01.CDS01 [Anthostomella pinea]